MAAPHVGPMLDHRPFATLGAADHGWLDARHHFSFAGYHDPARMGWGAIRVWNDDAIAAGRGFAPHPHRDMEIVTYVREGAITHEDSMGNRGVTRAGDVQVMSAGTGVVHSEVNAGAEPCRLFQIWILPDRAGARPQWGTKPFPMEARGGRFDILASGHAEDVEAGALPIQAAARVLGARLPAGARAEVTLPAGRVAYAVPARGRVRATADGRSVELDARDGLAVAEAASLAFEALDDAEIVTVEAAR